MPAGKERGPSTAPARRSEVEGQRRRGSLYRRTAGAAGEERMEIRIGTSGWSCDHWQGVLYPRPTPVERRLGYYAARFDAVEVNATYYRWPEESVFARWHAETPEGFRFAVKANRGLTHFRKLREPQEWIERSARGLERLGEKLGPFVVQLPASFGYQPERLDTFLRLLPEWIRPAVELRNPTWNREETFRLLEARGAAYCIMSGAGLPLLFRVTAPFVYVRFHGPDPNVLYGGSYSDEALRLWAERIRGWAAEGRDVWGFFNNDWEGHAVRNAETLRRILGLETSG